MVADGRGPPRRRRRLDAARATTASTPAEEAARVVPVIRALAAALPATPISIDTTSPAVAAAALDAGAHLLNDIWGVADDPAMVRLAAERGVPIVADAQPRRAALPRTSSPRSSRTCSAAIDRALDAGVPWDAARSSTRGSGSARRPTTTSRCWRASAPCACWGGRCCSGRRASRRWAGCSTCPPDQRVEATLATTALGDRRRASTSCASTTSARTCGRRAIADAVVRGWRPPGWGEGRRRDRPDHPRRHGVRGHPRRLPATSSVTPQRFEVDVELALDLAAGRPVRRPRADARLRQGVRDLPPDRRVHPLRPDRGARRGDRARDPGRASPPTRSPSACASRRCGSAARSAAPGSRSARRRTG